MKEKMKKYKITYRGITPLVWNRLKLELIQMIKAAKKDELENIELNNWIMKAETSNGNAIIPSSWIMGNLVNSAKQTRIIPHFATSKNQTYTSYISSMKINPLKPIVAGKTKDLKRKIGIFNSRGIQKGGKVMRCHPVLDSWSCEFELIDVVGKMRLVELRELLEWGGMMNGLGDQRYDNFGRFEVTDISEVK